MIFKKIVLISLLLFPALGMSITIDEALFSLSFNLYEQGKYADAAKQFQNLLARHPGSDYYTDSLYYTAKSLYNTADYETALTYYELYSARALTDVEKRQALFGLGQCAYQLQEWPDSAETFTEFVNAYPDSPVADAALYYGGLSYQYMGTDDSAETLYEHLTYYYPSSPYYEKTLEKLIALRDIPVETESEPAFAVLSATGNSSADESEIIESETLTGSGNPSSVTYNIYTTPENAVNYFPLNEVDLYSGTIPVNNTNSIPSTPSVLLTPHETLTNPVTSPQTNVPAVSVKPATVTTESSLQQITVTNFVKVAFTNFVTVTNRHKPAKVYFTNKTFVTNTVKITNVLLTTNLSMFTQMVLLTNLSMFTQHVMFTNLSMLTQMVSVLDSNTVLIDNQLLENTQVEEEIDRLRSLTELKAKLLDMKELALEQKEELLRETNYISGKKK